VTQSLDKIVGSIASLLFRDGLIDGQENLKGYSLVGLQLMGKLFNIRLGRILTQRAKTFTNLMLLNLSIATIVEEIESLLEFCVNKFFLKKMLLKLNVWKITLD
jgi:hypothetical protein